MGCCNKVCMFISGTCCPFVLKQAAVPIDDLYSCNETSNLHGQITENMFCAGIGGNDACNVRFCRLPF